jgi:hypothetical protein
MEKISGVSEGAGNFLAIQENSPASFHQQPEMNVLPASTVPKKGKALEID